MYIHTYIYIALDPVRMTGHNELLYSPAPSCPYKPSQGRGAPPSPLQGGHKNQSDLCNIHRAPLVRSLSSCFPMQPPPPSFDGGRRAGS